MLLLRLWNYIRGYVIILVEGYFLEKFINICAHRQIFLWDIRRQKNCIMSLKVSIRGFKMLRPVAKKTNCRVRIVKKRGLPFIFNKYKGRKFFVSGAVIFILLVYTLTSFIWVVEITGNKKLDTQYIMDKLASFGVKPGVLKYKVNTDKVVNDMMLDMGELGWISVLVKGTKVKVQIVERKTPPELVPSDEPCNIVAKKDGIIKSTIVKDGQEMVKTGDTVVKGQMLVSGAIPVKGEEGKMRLVHAIGSIKARTWYEEKCPVILRTIEKIRTGKTSNNYSLLIFSKKFNIFNGKINFENYDKVEIRKRVSIGEDLVLPLGLLIDKYYENSLTEKETDIEDAKQVAANKAYSEIMERLPQDAEIVKTDLNFIQNGDEELFSVVTVECIEEIGVTQKIGGK